MKMWIFAVLAAAVLSGCATCDRLPNLGLYKQALVEWHDDGGYDKCFRNATRPAFSALRRVIALRRPGDRIAIVLDIDETALTNWGYLTAVGFNLSPVTFEAWVGKHNDPALDSTLSFYREAKAAGIPVFFITGRKEMLRADTVRQLRAAGYAGWAGLFMAPIAYRQDSVVPYKSGVRKKLTGEGWKIVINMGDQWSDLEGGYGETAVKLPNPFYFIR